MNILPFPQRPQRGPLAACLQPLSTDPAGDAGHRFAAALEALRVEHELTLRESANLAEIIARVSGMCL